jgi:hypothetical protein
MSRQGLVRDTASFAAGLIGGAAFWYVVIRGMVNQMVGGKPANPSNHSLWPLLAVGFVAFYVCYKTIHWLLGKVKALEEPQG